MFAVLRRLCAALFAGSLLLIGSPALAHVTVSSPDAKPGGWGKIVFRVPTESDAASTTGVTVTFPADKPFAFLSVQPKPGWKATLKKSKLAKPISVEGMNLSEAVASVTWTATAGGIAPGEFDEFAVSGGPVPDATALSFAATQKYSDGTVVKWDEVQSGSKEPEHPAPTLTFADAPAETTAKAKAEPDNVARGLGAAALAIAVIGAFVAFRRRA